MLTVACRPCYYLKPPGVCLIIIPVLFVIPPLTRSLSSIPPCLSLPLPLFFFLLSSFLSFSFSLFLHLLISRMHKPGWVLKPYSSTVPLGVLFIQPEVPLNNKKNYLPRDFALKDHRSRYVKAIFIFYGVGRWGGYTVVRLGPGMALLTKYGCASAIEKTLAPAPSSLARSSLICPIHSILFPGVGRCRRRCCQCQG